MNNKERYIEFCIDNKNIPLFHQPWWLDIFTDGNWDVALSSDKNGDIKAVMPYRVIKKYGLSIIAQPSLSPYLGILFFAPSDLNKRTSIYSFQNKHISAIIEQLPKNMAFQYFQFVSEFDNWLPFYAKSFEQTTRYTYIIDGIKDYEEVYSKFTNTIKRQIKEAQNNVSITQEDNLCLVFSLVKESLERQGVKFPLHRDTLKTLERIILEKKQGKVFIARDKDGNVSSGVFVVWDDSKAYLLGLGTSKEYDNNNSTKLLILESIKYVSKYVDKFDFEGSMLPGVERLYRSFGGERTSYYAIKKYKNRFYKAMFALLNK